MVKRKRIIMVLMIMALVSSCVVWGTYAKYTKSDSGMDVARIAKFGVVIQANGTMFSTAYDSEEQRESGSVKSVLSTDKVIAPGTRGDMISMSVSGKPEVSIGVKYAAELNLSNWEVPSGESKIYYCPITITVDSIDFAGTDYQSAEEFSAAVIAAIENCSAEYAVESFSQKSDIKEVIKVPSVSWRWEFEGGKINDEYDTYLGNRACETSEGNDKISTINLVIKTTITQLN